MKFYTVTDHDGHWPVGQASIVFAENEDHGIALLNEQLEKQGLKTWKDKQFTLNELPTDIPYALILVNGEY